MNERTTLATSSAAHRWKTYLYAIVTLAFVFAVFGVALLPHPTSAANDTIVFQPVADTYVSSDSATMNYGTSSHFDADSKPTIVGLLRFAISGVDQSNIASVRLRLYVSNSSKKAGLQFYATSSDWDEKAVTWNTRPATGPLAVALAPIAMPSKSWVDVDFTPAITGNGTYSFIMTTDSSDRVAFSALGKNEAPQLTITLKAPQVGGQSAPTATSVPATKTSAPAGPTQTPAPAQPSQTPPPVTQNNSAGFLTTASELRQRKQLADQGVEPYKSAVSDVISYANGALGSSPSPQQPLDIPDTSGPFVDDTATAYGLALAYGITGDSRYAQKSRDFIMAWVNTTKSTQNTCPDSGSCQTSLIIGRAAPGFVFAADLIKSSGAFSNADDAAFQDWLRSVILPTASTRTNNWGDAGTFMRAAVTAYLNDQAGFNAAIAKWKSLVDLTASDGSIPEETRRGTSGINYTQEAIDYRIGVVKIAERRGIDLWSYGRFKQSVDYVAPYILNPGSWPWASGASATIHPVWEVAYQHWQNSAYTPIIKQRRPYGSDGHSALRWVTLTNGIPFN